MSNGEQSLPEKEIPLFALVESLLFVADEPVTVERLAEALEVKTDAVEAVLQEMSTNGAYRGVRLQRKGDRVQLVTRPEAAAYVERFMGLDTAGRLSQAALETLAIVAYRQPCTRVQLESVRGVNCDGVLKTLLTKGLIEETGRLDTVGHPIQYATTFAFLQHFGLNSLDELPPLEPAQTPTLVEPEEASEGSEEALADDEERGMKDEGLLHSTGDEGRMTEDEGSLHEANKEPPLQSAGDGQPAASGE
jgi:segregation and condensation protein B